MGKDKLKVLTSIVNNRFEFRYPVDNYGVYERGSERILYDAKRDEIVDKTDVRLYQTRQKPLPSESVQRELSDSVPDLRRPEEPSQEISSFFYYSRSEKHGIKEYVSIFLTTLSLITISAAGGYVAALTIKSFWN